MTQTDYFINQAVFGAAGTAHSFPNWWGNGKYYVIQVYLSPTSLMYLLLDLNLSADRCLAPDN